MTSWMKRWTRNGGSNPGKLEERLRAALTDTAPTPCVKVFTPEEIAEYEKELKERDKKRSR